MDGLSFAQTADRCADDGGRLPELAEMQDYMKGRNFEPVYQQDVWVAVNGEDGDDWVRFRVSAGRVGARERGGWG
jgi:hypothetical protein